MPAAPDEMDQKSKLLYAVNGVAEILLTVDDEKFENSLRCIVKLIEYLASAFCRNDGV